MLRRRWRAIAGAVAIGPRGRCRGAVAARQVDGLHLIQVIHLVVGAGVVCVGAGACMHQVLFGVEECACQGAGYEEVAQQSGRLDRINATHLFKGG